MPKSARGILMFAIASVITVVVGLAIYNRLAPRVPMLARVVSGARSEEA